MADSEAFVDSEAFADSEGYTESDGERIARVLVIVFSIAMAGVMLLGVAGLVK